MFQKFAETFCKLLKVFIISNFCSSQSCRRDAPEPSTRR